MAIPDSKKIYPREGDDTIVYLKNVITNPNIEVGDFTFYNDFVNDPRDFEKNNVLYHYPINHDKLIIGKFCSIACGTKFLFNSANHTLRSLSTYPFPKTLGRRNTRKGVFMTRKQAIFKVILKIRAQKGQNEALIAKLTEIADAMPFVKWSEGTVRDCVEQFMSNHKRLPTVTDFRVKDGMPAHTIFPYLFRMTAHEWMERNFPTYYEPTVTIRQALRMAIEVAAEDDEAAGKLRDILSEYPLTKWNEKNIGDGLETFFDMHGYLPRKEDYQTEKYLPFVDIYRYRYRMRRNAWIELHCPALMQKEREHGRTYKQSSLHVFAKEYERIRPLTKEEFNRKRDGKICSADYIMRCHNIKRWEALLARCGLKRYTNDAPPVKLINNVVAIVF